jgi:hypothetical protein
VARRQKLTDDELRGICEQELTNAVAFSTDLSEERAKALDYYLGEPLGNEVDGRSQVRTREVLDTVEWVLASLMRIFADAKNICLFEPHGPEDEEAAQQESDAVEQVFWRENRGFYNLYAFLKDGLLTKNAVLKVWWNDTPERERETYKNLNEYELAQLMEDENLEVISTDVNDDGTFNLQAWYTKSKGRIEMEPCPPEEFGVSRDARSPYPEDSVFSFHRTRVTKGELVAQGYDRKFVEGLPSSRVDVLTTERLARRNLSDEREDFDYSDHWSLHRVWVTECYLKIDADGDGEHELMCVKLAGQDSNYATGSILMEKYEVDRVPFVVWAPVLRTHTFYGLSMADMVMDIQEIVTSLTRQMLDSTYLANNGRTAVNERVNLDDLLTSRPGGIVRVEGYDPPANSLLPIPQQPVPAQSFEMLERLDEMRKGRTGVGDETGALDADALAKVNTGVAALAFDAARSKIELIARVAAEVGLRPLFLRIHELLRKHGEGKKIALRTRNGWVETRPQEWRERSDMVVQVGVGKVSRERRIIALGEVLNRQQAAIEAGGLGVVLTPDNLYRGFSDYARELGVEESLYFTDPKKQKPKPPTPDYQAGMLQVQQGAVDAQMQRNQVELYKAKAQERMQQLEAQQRLQEQRLNMELETQRAKLEAAKQGHEIDSDIQRLDLEKKIKDAEIRLEHAQQLAKAENEAAKREVDVYKSLLAASTTLTQEQLTAGTSADPQGAVRSITADVNRLVAESAEALASSMRAQLGEITAKLTEQADVLTAPKQIIRDDSGRVVQVGNRMVQRDREGRIVSIG